MSFCRESGSHPLFCFFFFQAEDGIRDLIVTGVQTCALPIWSDGTPGGNTTTPPTPPMTEVPEPTPVPTSSAFANVKRSEERRVGKECRSRWSPNHEKEKRVTSEGG